MTRRFPWITPTSLTRLLVISYFIAVSLGLIQGSNLLELLTPLLPETLATPLMRGLILTLSVLILTGLARRTSALVLSLVVFFSSYAALYEGGDISAFWRDLALVGALLMTANFKGPQERDLDWSTTQNDLPRKDSPTKDHDDPVSPLDDSAFRDDFDMVRSG